MIETDETTVTVVEDKDAEKVVVEADGTEEAPEPEVAETPEEA
ncbi:MAG: hypothetical protein NUV80_04960 [Candidatus Berkelbacteria bacterium]|nr:hypothetical protein [Candidatus Berkelbacteria bacterium]